VDDDEVVKALVVNVLWCFREYITSVALREPVKSVNVVVDGGEEVAALVLLLRT
jgi:hypothetical protein